MLTLAVTKRAAGTNAAAVRAGGAIPAVVYGKTYEATPIAVDAKVFEKTLRDAGEATVVSLTGLGAAVPVLIHEVDVDPLTGAPRHVDFYAITAGETVEVAVPLTFVGESAAAEAGANIVKVLHEIEIEADPTRLPHEIAVDLAALAALGDRIHAKDLVLPAGVTLAIDPEEVIALAQEVEEEAEEAPVADIGAIEVEKKGKEEEPKAE
jgi:large subunit ribosomal protein L25